MGCLISFVFSRYSHFTPFRSFTISVCRLFDTGVGLRSRPSVEMSSQAVMDSGMKIQRASNPSGVAMSRARLIIATLQRCYHLIPIVHICSTSSRNEPFQQFMDI